MQYAACQAAERSDVRALVTTRVAMWVALLPPTLQPRSDHGMHCNGMYSVCMGDSWRDAVFAAQAILTCVLFGRSHRQHYCHHMMFQRMLNVVCVLNDL